jgi:hypothetical protein
MQGKDSKASDPMTRAVLAEILEHLRQLHNTGVTARIDVRRLPLPADGLASLIADLGKGEVEATMRGVLRISGNQTFGRLVDNSKKCGRRHSGPVY